MKWKQLLAVVGLVGLGSIGLAVSCVDQQARDAAAAAKADAAAAKAQIAIIDGYLRELYPWALMAANAVCQLEVKNPAGLDPAKRICPGTPPDIKPPPVYPPQ